MTLHNTDDVHVYSSVSYKILFFICGHGHAASVGVTPYCSHHTTTQFNESAYLMGLSLCQMSSV